MSNFSKRKYLKNFPKQKVVKEKETIEYKYEEVPELYATTELTVEEYLVENYSEVYEKSITNQEVFSIKNLQINTYKKAPSDVYHANKVVKNKISIKSKNRPNEPKDILTTVLLLGFGTLLSIILIGWENRLEKRKNRVSKKKCVVKNCNDPRKYHDAWGPSKLFKRSWKMCGSHYQNYIQIKSSKRAVKRNLRYSKELEKSKRPRNIKRNQNEVERYQNRKKRQERRAGLGRDLHIITALKILALIVVGALAIAALALAITALYGLWYVWFILAPTMDAGYWLAFFYTLALGGLGAMVYKIIDGTI